MIQIGHALRKEFLIGPTWHWPLTYKLYVKSLHDHKHSMSEVWARLNQREKSYAPDKIFIYNSVITLSFNWQTWFKITALPLLNYIAQCVEVWAWLGRGGGREDILWTSGLGQTTDGLITIRCPHTGTLIVKKRLINDYVTIIEYN